MMIARIFNVFETTETQLTKASITRLRISSVLSFFVIPCFIAFKLFSISEPYSSVVFVIGLLSLVAMLYCYATRLANRLWIPEKYLDEVEVERKRRSMSLSAQIMLGALAILMSALVVLDNMGIGSNLNWGLYEVAFICAMIFFALLSLQISIASWMLEPLSDARAAKVAADGRYKWIALGIIVGSAALGVLIANTIG